MAGRGRVQKRMMGSKAGFHQKAESHDTVHPQVLKQARKSGQLNISGRSLTQVPDAVWRINIDIPEECRDVSLANTEDRWWEQVDLTKLILASNWLTSLPEDLKQLPALTVIDIHDNRLESLPDALGQLENLQKLDISRNHLTTLSSSLCHLKCLVSLHVEHNQLAELCDDIGRLDSLQDLDVSNNVLSTLPPSIGYLSQLSKLNVSNNKLVTLPPEIGDLNGLKYFDATHNQLVELPQEFGNLRRLEQLYLRHNKLTYLPILENCGNLKELHLGNNQLNALTSEHLVHLKSVTVLDLRDNKISNLPDEITLLQGLQRLDVTNNDLSGLPYALGSIDSLNSLVLDGNPMKSIRRDIVMRGTVSLKKYLKSRMEEPDVVSKADGDKDSPLPGMSSDRVRAHELHQFKTLDYSNRKATTLPEDIMEEAKTSGVVSINLNKNLFTNVPENLVYIGNTLRELYLGYNKISSLSSDISLYLKLTTLDLRCNTLSDLPHEMDVLDNLREITISNNRFTRLPPVLFELKKLEILFAADNKIDTIDAVGLQKLPLLATLDLQNNNCSQIPPELGNCLSLKSLQLSGNPCRNPRPAILTKGTPAILEYLRGRIIT
ncbi:leucine-rich repeat-containing protein 40-like [Gigantopelta aegis]|uniref:leucine-rich repeat-containing protein 40-like n=1 Tax=Gigantopelta aegis TaxID=1735272 RepID=UPI001B88CABA|nr:leucine-rich repeat-containing protein 40-like [Gigantopelta aegis]